MSDCMYYVLLTCAFRLYIIVNLSIPISVLSDLKQDIYFILVFLKGDTKTGEARLDSFILKLCCVFIRSNKLIQADKTIKNEAH
jgi:hypothetical protein